MLPRSCDRLSRSATHFFTFLPSYTTNSIARLALGHLHWTVARPTALDSSTAHCSTHVRADDAAGFAQQPCNGLNDVVCAGSQPRPHHEGLQHLQAPGSQLARRPASHGIHGLPSTCSRYLCKRAFNTIHSTPRLRPTITPGSGLLPTALGCSYSTSSGPSVDKTEAAKFAALAAEWWNPSGPFAPLHALNPLRTSFIRDTACEALGRNSQEHEPLKGLKVLDVGCGGGILSEALAYLGADVVGIDVSDENIGVASTHAQQNPSIRDRIG